MDFLLKIFNTDFATRWEGTCGGWTKGLAIAHVIADLFIFLAYMLIPIMLAYLLAKRRDIPFNIFLLLFAIFIVGCGLTHLSGAITVFIPLYYLDFWIKIGTAAASIGTAYWLYRFLPVILETPNPVTVNKQLIESNHELEQFAYVASHDLQEPLRMVASYCKLLEKRYKDKLDQDGVDFINFAVDGAKRMQTLINDLLHYSRIGTRGKELKPTDMNKCLKIALNNLGEMIQNEESVITSEKLPTVLGDEIQVIQILQNLIGNAVKYHKEDIPSFIQISCKRDYNFGYQFCVQDNGIGIEDSNKDRLFIIFQRLHTDNIKYPGTGIGLAICRKIVTRHGGKIWFESEFGVGSKFFFTLRAANG